MNKLPTEIALELTIAIIGNIQPTTRTTAEEMNKSLAEEVAKAYSLIYSAVKDATKQLAEAITLPL